MIDLHLIRTDGLTQSRAKLNEDVVAEYAELYRAGVQFPPVIVFYDGKDRWLADGFHRYFGAKAAGLTSIHENITPGTRREAVLHSLGANGTHGLPRTNADKRNAVTTMIEDEEWTGWSNVAIAKACAVSEGFVRSLRINEVTSPAERTYTTKHGTTATMQTANIGKPLPCPAPPQQDEQVAPDQEDYTELDAAQDQISELQSMLVVANLGDVSDEDKLQAAALIADLQAEIKTLTASLNAVSQSRDSLMQEVAQLKKQCQMQRKEIEKLKPSK